MFYIFHGDDEHSKREYLSQLQEKLGDMALVELNTTRFDGRSLSFSALQHACESVPFLSDRRLVIVDDLLLNKPEYLDELVLYVEKLPATTRLVFWESRLLKKNHPLILLAQQSDQGYVKLFKRLEVRELPQWIQHRISERGGRISSRAAHMLAINVGNDLALLDNEIEKLVLYKGAEQIEVDDISLLCPFVAEASIFDLVDALGSRHRRTAAELLQSKIADGTDPGRLFYMITRQYRLLIQAKELAVSDSRPDEISRVLNIPAFVASKLIQQSQNYSLEQLEQIYAHLLDMDVGVKTGKTDLPTALNLLVAGLVT
jgi:DNA polymerase-3 subunit delta